MDAIRQKAQELLEAGEVKAVIGYAPPPKAAAE